MSTERLYGGIEAGGTKFICAVGSGPGEIIQETRIATTTPDETLGKVIRFFRAAMSDKPVAVIGVASFGPVDLHHGSSTYGYITSTTKPGWRDTNVVGRLRRELGVEI